MHLSARLSLRTPVFLRLIWIFSSTNRCSITEFPFLSFPVSVRRDDNEYVRGLGTGKLKEEEGYKMVDSIARSPAQEEKREAREVRKSGREWGRYEGSGCYLGMGETDGQLDGKEAAWRTRGFHSGKKRQIKQRQRFKSQANEQSED